MTDTTIITDPEAPAFGESGYYPADVLTYEHQGKAVTISAERLDDLASAFGTGRGARLARALAIGHFLEEYPGMSVKRALDTLKRAGHYGVHRDTANNAANAYNLTVQNVAGTDAQNAIIPDVYSLLDLLGVKRTREIIGADELATIEDMATRGAAFTAAVREALAIARTGSAIIPAELETDPAGDSDEADGEPTQTAPAAFDYAAVIAAMVDAATAVGGGDPLAPLDDLAAAADLIMSAVNARHSAPTVATA